MKEDLSFFLYMLTSLFTIANPLGAMPVFSAITDGEDRETSKYVARKACLAAFVAMVFFALGGKFLFEFFSVSVDGLRVVGGILFFIMGYDMLQGKESRTKSVSPSERVSLKDIGIKAITPLAIPVICGPGTITVITVHMQATESGIQAGLLLLATLVVSLVIYFSFLFAQEIMGFIGESGQKVFFRMMGLILMMIAVEFFFAGLKPYISKLTAAS